MSEAIAPGAVIGILGGGQLGRMTALAAARLGYRSLIFEPQAGCPASHVADHIEADYSDRDALARFADLCDVVTLEFENVPTEALDFLSDHVPVRPGSRVLSVAQDRVFEKEFLNRAGVETAPWCEVTDAATLKEAVAQIGAPAVLKTCRLGYDGKGQVVLPVGATDEDFHAAWEKLGSVRCILEGFVAFDCEFSVIAARSASGEVAYFPAVMNEHRDHILHKTHAPADLAASITDAARAAAHKAVTEFDLIGLLALEFFATPDGRAVANEMAPRPHNSGHWSMDACETDQFEQLVRAVCGLPLGGTTPLYPSVMTNLIGDDVDEWQDALRDPRAKLHLYGKAEARPGRKMGHITRPKG